MPSVDIALAGFGVPWQVIAGFLAGALIAWGLRRAQKAAPRMQGSTRVLYCPRVLLVFVLLIVLLFGGLFGVAVSVVTVDESKDALVIAVLGLIALGAAGIAWTLYRSRIRWDDTAIVRESAWRGPRTCSWEEVTEVRYAPIGGALRIRAGDGTRFKVPLHYTGIASFVDTMERCLPPERYEGARPGIERVRAGRA